ncbi:MAG: MBL fold metallo-hydrolase [Meiothermus sp.]|nr:MBL fold metallo-hydrolase [Meiothermus sp.]
MIHVLDVHDRAPRVIAAFLLETPAGPILFETGPESRFSSLLDGLNVHGYRADDINHVFVTHIHLDHSGAAWRFAELGATVYVHPKGAPHLADPSKLWASAARIYGDQMELLWGQMGAVPEARLRILNDGDRVEMGGVVIEALETPGHANHHHVYKVGRELIAGDVAGIHIGNGPILPPCPPPEIHIENWQASLRKLKALELDTLYLTHFGTVANSPRHWDDLEAKLLSWGEWMKVRLKAGKTRDQIVAEFEQQVAAELRAFGLGEEEIKEYEYADPAWMTVDGLIRYWNKVHPEEVMS